MTPKAARLSSRGILSATFLHENLNREKGEWCCELLDDLRHKLRCHFGSRAISVQVNIVAVSDHVFHRFPYDLLIQVFATQLSLFLCISFALMVSGLVSEDALHTSFPGSPPLSSNVGFPNGSVHDLDGITLDRCTV